MIERNSLSWIILKGYLGGLSEGLFKGLSEELYEGLYDPVIGATNPASRKLDIFIMIKRYITAY
jgi:hypothetical protein